MNEFEKFSGEQRDLLVALPYRVGLWLSKCDDSGGHDATDAEVKALEIIIRSYAEDFCKSEFVEDIMRETLARKNDWERWRENTDNVPRECSQAVDMLAEKIERKHIAYFKHDLMDIANSVATAHGEFEEGAMNFSDKMWILSRYVCGRIKGAFTKQPFSGMDELLRISRKEDAALKTLTAALRIDKIEGLPDRDPYESTEAA